MKPDVKTERDKKDLSSSNYMNLSQHAEARSKGAVGSSLGYGAGLPSYQDTSSKLASTNQYGNGRIGGSQFSLSGNVKDPSLSYGGSQSYVSFQQQDYPQLYQVNNQQLSSKQSYQGMYPSSQTHYFLGGAAGLRYGLQDL